MVLPFYCSPESILPFKPSPIAVYLGNRFCVLTLIQLIIVLKQKIVSLQSKSNKTSA